MLTEQICPLSAYQYHPCQKSRFIRLLPPPLLSTIHVTPELLATLKKMAMLSKSEPLCLTSQSHCSHYSQNLYKLKINLAKMLQETVGPVYVLTGHVCGCRWALPSAELKSISSSPWTSLCPLIKSLVLAVGLLRGLIQVLLACEDVLVYVARLYRGCPSLLTSTCNPWSSAGETDYHSTWMGAPGRKSGIRE